MIKYDNNDTEQEEKSRRSFSLSLLVACFVKKFALGESFESSQSPTTNAARRTGKKCTSNGHLEFSRGGCVERMGTFGGIQTKSVYTTALCSAQSKITLRLFDRPNQGLL